MMSYKPERGSSMSSKKDIGNLSVEELQELKNKVESALKEKKKSIKRKRTPKDPEKRKKTLRVRKSKYIEIYYKNLEGQTVCEYIGIIGEPSTLEKLQQLNKPELMEQYQEILQGL